MGYTSEQLISMIKANCQLPVSQNKFSNSNFLSFLNEELRLTITGELADINQEYFVKYTDIPLVASQSDYEIPTTAIGWGMRDVGFVGADGVYNTLNEIQLENIDRARINTESTKPLAFYKQHTDIISIPSISASPESGSWRIYFEKIQNELILTTSCGRINTILDTGTDYILTLDSLPTTTNGVDIIGYKNPFNVIADGLTAVVGGFNVTVTKTGFTKAPVVGDYVAETGKTCYPNIPEDFHGVLAMAASIRVAIASKDEKQKNLLESAMALMLNKLRKRSGNRSKGTVKKINPKNYVLSAMRGYRS